MQSSGTNLPGEQGRRFAVTWRNPFERSNKPVAVLDELPGGFRFQYIPEAVRNTHGFRPLIGFPDLARVYESDKLWPFFRLRVMDRKRPDFDDYVRWLGLSVRATPADILARSGGDRKGDSISVALAPRVALDGRTNAIFLVSGSGYALAEGRAAESAASLRDGQPLVISVDKDNVANNQALLLSSESGTSIGWVPELLINFTQTIGGDREAILLQNNGPRAPWHMRFLVELTGYAPPGTTFFRGGGWPE